MFTQCPQCDAVFRITAEVLQQARGQVRCGNCDHAFNALDHLSEEPPAVAALPANAPDGDPEAGDNRSQALLKTLDRLAGPDDIRIEDTGVEWLVVDEDDEPTNEQDPPHPDATGSMRWIIEGSEDGAAADEAELPEVSDQVSAEVDLESTATTEQLVLDEQTALQFGSQTDEPRYDDNTPLPDDFEEQQSVTPPSAPQRRSTDQGQDPVEPDEQEDGQNELELSEPGDWTDLLEEVDAAPAGETDGDVSTAAKSSSEVPVSDAGDLPLEVEEELAAIHDELSTMPGPGGGETVVEPLALDDDDLDITLDAEPESESGSESESEVAVVASQLDDLLEAMGTNKFKTPSPVTEEGSENDDGALSDEMLSLVEDAIDEAAEEVAVDTSTGTAPETAIDAAQAEATPVGEHDDKGEAPDEEAEPVALDEEAEPIALNEEGDSVAETADAEVEPDGAAIEYEETTGEFERAIADAEGAIRAELAESDDEQDPDEIGLASDDGTPIAGHTEDGAEDGDRDNGQVEDDAAELGEDGADDRYDDLAAMTGNMKIDANLLRAMNDDKLAASMMNEDGSPLVETIVMEGDVVSGALHDAIDVDANKNFTTEEIDTPRDLEDPGSLVDTYMFSRDDKRSGSSFSGKRAVAAIIVLVLLLIGQFIHGSRESLATLGAFNQTLGPVYRMFGSPVTPTWDIKGWQFEATNGSTSEDDSVLTIHSRISNRAQQRLPYPLVHVSLTDRYEEIIGSRVMEPNEYLAGNADPSRLVAAGDNFTAVITIASPSADATGFKLNVCYRVTPGRVRCAIEDFEAP